jgi:hypothetical protein
MDDHTFGLLALFSLFSYFGTVIFSWAIYRENCLASNNSSTRKNIVSQAIGNYLYPANPSLRNYIRTHLKSLTLFGLTYLGILGFFLNHVCYYP